MIPTSREQLEVFLLYIYRQGLLSFREDSFKLTGRDLKMTIAIVTCPV